MFIIYGQPNCIWCDRAKDLLRGVSIYKDVRSDPLALRDMLEEFPGAQKVPKIVQILDDGTVVNKFNSYEELRDWHSKPSTNE